MLILASNSPRRKQLFDLTGWEYQVLAATVDESIRSDEPADVYVRRLAQEKAWAVLPLLPPAEKSQVTILAADTAVVLRGDILGKPSGPAEAEAMLRRLRNCAHQVYTGLAVLRPGDGAELSDVVATEVYMRDYSDAEIQTYVAGGDPLDKAGAYAIQHADFHPVQNLQGCYANVMGLPVCHLAQMLARFGFQPRHSMIDDCQQAIHHPCPIFIQVMQERQATHW